MTLATTAPMFRSAAAAFQSITINYTSSFSIHYTSSSFSIYYTSSMIEFVLKILLKIF